ncbi:MAG: SpoIIE family protein phosphatase [Leptospiraceae bacterium]|nr:SpoIIE family protein phosphatase [Leptospiraceae bacterium]MDW8306163.1 SpoIIE family protein phosphatase [Leptospiraceae bacterium]
MRKRQTNGSAPLPAPHLGAREAQDERGVSPLESHERILEERLARAFFSNVKLAIFGLTGAQILFFYMISRELPKEIILPWFYGQLFLVFCVGIILFFFENRFSSNRFKMRFMNVIIGLSITACGLGFYDLLPRIKDFSTLIVSYTLIAGVLGAASFTFTASKYTFLIFAAGWSLPMFYYLAIESGNFAYQILSAMLVIYVAVLYFLSSRDYERRRALILTELSLQEERDLVVASSKKLQETFEVVNQLKQQQDGDYYLTALLLKPLTVNTTKPSQVVVDFHIEQKKKFEFRKRKNEIGGDICIAHTIRLRNQDYTVFLNADAMGKSIQGASGALVLGAVFQSIIERTRMKEEYSQMYPERWLKNAFIELQKVFESFDGSMLVSSILGLVQNETGLLYLINAEHPFAVLLRDGKASFVGESPYYRKLGTPGLEGPIMVVTFPLQAGDIFILGSDGRDDLLLPHPGGRILNEDETLFLSLVEKSRGDLEKLCQLLKETGELTDDLSLMRIEYRDLPRPAPKITGVDVYYEIQAVRAALQKNDLATARMHLLQLRSHDFDDVQLLKALTHLAYRSKDYESAAYFTDKYLEILPQDNNYIFLSSLAFKKHRKYEIAKELAERLRIRDPYHIKNLFNLAEIYYHLGNYEQSLKFVEEILTQNPENRHAQDLRIRLRKLLASASPSRGKSRGV